MASPPLSARVRNFIGHAYTFLGLYLTTLFSFDAYAAAEHSSFNPKRKVRPVVGVGAGPRPDVSGGEGGGGANVGGGRGVGRRLGTLDEVRAPESRMR
ncbi:MAG: hypothetical protein ASARMPREDX12_003609 [Alectoria sarmentosa]|nr:MAG: hypothetical protein ASARMPREDX12_003609 [Alectoria sarmentosa]